MGNLKKYETLDSQYIIKFFKKNWMIIGMCIFISITGAYIFNKITTEVYNVSTSIVINEESGGLADASAQLLNEFGFISVNKSFANELFVLQSTPLINSAIENLDFQISYYEHDIFSQRELYKSSPFIVILDKNYSQPIGVKFYIEFIDSVTCKISIDESDVKIYSFVSDYVVQENDKMNFEQVVHFDSYIYSDYMKFKILLNSSVDIEEIKGKKYSFKINTFHSLVKSYKARLKVLPSDLESSVAEIQLDTENPEKSIDFLNRLTDAYINIELEKKRHSSIRTIEYINNQLNVVGDSLRRAEQNLQSFRTQNDVTDISLQSGQFFEEMRELENKRAILDVNSKYYAYVKDYFNENQEFDELIAPSAMGINDPMLNSLIEELIRLNAERASFIENKQAKSPYLKKINIRIENLRKMVVENITYYDQTNSINIDDLDRRIKKLNSEMRQLPAAQRVLVGIERKFNINDAIYTYLLEKKAEAEIAKASYQADSEIIEPASIVGLGPIAPKKTMNYIIALFLGIFFPVLIIRLKELLQISVTDIKELDRLVTLPILGKISHNEKNVENVVEEFPLSYVSENFRHVHMGFKYFFKEEQSRIIVFSSAISGEGKSFVALNTAMAIAASGKKTIHLSFDLRKINLKSTGEEKKNGKVYGLTEYLYGRAELSEVIVKSSSHEMDRILSGASVPNPEALVSSNKTAELFTQLKKDYKYIIVDTSPIGLVSDAYNLMTYADLNILLFRLKKTPKSEFIQLQQDIEDKNLTACVIVNDVSLARRNKYGSQYYK